MKKIKKNFMYMMPSWVTHPTEEVDISKSAVGLGVAGAVLYQDGQVHTLSTLFTPTTSPVAAVSVGLALFFAGSLATKLLTWINNHTTLFVRRLAQIFFGGQALALGAFVFAGLSVGLALGIGLAWVSLLFGVLTTLDYVF